MARIDRVRAQYEQITEQLFSDGKAFADYLAFSGRFFKLPASHTLTIFADNPKATMVADYDTWQKFGRRVKRGFESTAVLSDNGLKHYFDISLTSGDTVPYQWALDKPLAEQLASSFSQKSITGCIEHLASEEMRENSEKLANDFNIPESDRAAFEKSVTSMVEAVMAARCSFPENKFKWGGKVDLAAHGMLKNAAELEHLAQFVQTTAKNALLKMEKNIGKIRDERSVSYDGSRFNERSADMVRGGSDVLPRIQGEEREDLSARQGEIRISSDARLGADGGRRSADERADTPLGQRVAEVYGGKSPSGRTLDESGYAVGDNSEEDRPRSVSVSGHAAGTVSEDKAAPDERVSENSSVGERAENAHGAADNGGLGTRQEDSINNSQTAEADTPAVSLSDDDYPFPYYDEPVEESRPALTFEQLIADYVKQGNELRVFGDDFGAVDEDLFLMPDDPTEPPINAIRFIQFSGGGETVSADKVDEYLKAHPDKTADSIVRIDATKAELFEYEDEGVTKWERENFWFSFQDNFAAAYSRSGMDNIEYRRAVEQIFPSNEKSELLTALEQHRDVFIKDDFSSGYPVENAKNFTFLNMKVSFNDESKKYILSADAHKGSQVIEGAYLRGAKTAEEMEQYLVKNAYEISGYGEEQLQITDKQYITDKVKAYLRDSADSNENYAAFLSEMNKDSTLADVVYDKAFSFAYEYKVPLIEIDDEDLNDIIFEVVDSKERALERAEKQAAAVEQAPAEDEQMRLTPKELNKKQMAELEKLTSALEREYKTWDKISIDGNTDHFYEDGVSLELTRNHIISYKRELAEKYPDYLPEIYNRELPPEMPRDYQTVKAGDTLRFEYGDYLVLKNEKKGYSEYFVDLQDENGEVITQNLRDIKGKFENLTNRSKLPSKVISAVRVGDFYELYGEDARKAAAALDLVLTKKNGSDMTGFPVFALENNKQRLESAGFKLNTKGERLDNNIEPYFEIYQLKRGDDLHYHRFTPLNTLKREGLSVERENYDFVYRAPFVNGETLENIYRRFNINRPDDFKGHSLSVSDVVVIHKNGKATAHYVDDIGYTEIPDFLISREELLENTSALDKAKASIIKFYQSEYGDDENKNYDREFSDLSQVPLAYTTLGDDEIPIQVNADLENYKITKIYDDTVVDVTQYDSIEDMLGDLDNLDFSELIYLTEKQQGIYGVFGKDNFSERELMNIINRYDNINTPKEVVAGYFIENDSPAARGDYLKSIYNDEFTELIINDDRYGYKATSDGLLVWKDGFLSTEDKDKEVIKWDKVQELVEKLIVQREFLGNQSIIGLDEFIEKAAPGETKSADDVYITVKPFSKADFEKLGLDESKLYTVPEFNAAYASAEKAFSADEENADKVLTVTVTLHISGKDYSYQPMIGAEYGAMSAIMDDNSLTNASNINISQVEKELVSEIERRAAEKAVVQRENSVTLNIPFSEHPAFYDREGGYSFALGNKLLGVLDEKQHRERDIPDNNVGYYHKTDFEINAVIDGEEFNYEGRFDIGDGEGDLLAHLKNACDYYLSDKGKQFLSYDGKYEENRALWERNRDILIPFLEKHKELSIEDSKRFNEFMQTEKEWFKQPEKAADETLNDVSEPQKTETASAPATDNDVEQQQEQQFNLFGEPMEEAEPQPEKTIIGGVDIDEALNYELTHHGTGFQDGKFRIVDFYKENSPSNKDFAKHITKEYGIGGHYGGDGIIKGASSDGKGFEIVIRLDNNETTSVSWKWNKIAKRIAELIDKDEYITQDDIDNRIRNARYETEHYAPDTREYQRSAKVLAEYDLLPKQEKPAKEPNIPSPEDIKTYLINEMIKHTERFVGGKFGVAEFYNSHSKTNLSKFADHLAEGYEAAFGKYEGSGEFAPWELSEKGIDTTNIDRKTGETFPLHIGWFVIARNIGECIDEGKFFTQQELDEHAKALNQSETKPAAESIDWSRFTEKEYDEVKTAIKDKIILDGNDTYTLPLNSDKDLALSLEIQIVPMAEKWAVDYALWSDVMHDYINVGGYYDEDLPNSLDEFKATVEKDVAAEIPEIRETLRDIEAEREELDSIKNFKEKTEQFFKPIDGNTPRDIEAEIRDFVKETLSDNEIEAEVVGVAVAGSRSRGKEGENSDLDVVVEVKSDTKEYALFNVLNEQEYEIGGVNVDINPIRAEETGTLGTYLKTADEYLENKRTVKNSKSVDELQVGDLVQSKGEIWRISEIRGDFSLSLENTDKSSNTPIMAIYGNWKTHFVKDGYEYISPEEYEKTKQQSSDKSISEVKLKSTVIDIANGTVYEQDYQPPEKEQPEKSDIYSTKSNDKTPYEMFPIGKEITHNDRKFQIEKVTDSEVKFIDLTFFESAGRPISLAVPIAEAREMVEEYERGLAQSSQKELSDQLSLDDLTEDNYDSPAPVKTELVADISEQDISVPKHDFTITDEHLGEGGAKTKFAANVAAIKTLKAIEAENRLATPDEQETLSKYVGWGGISQAFDSKNNDWQKEYAELQQLLTEDEYEKARGSTLNAHYTTPTVISAIYKALDGFGFEGGNILEPAMGVGNFFGAMPADMRENSRLSGVELDDITGRIARQLYQNADIQIKGYEETDFPDNFYDVAVGNVPFGNYQVADTKFNKEGFLIHDYFFAKTIDKVAPNGIIAFVTSKGTLDKESAKAREYIAKRADLIGAIRLPGGKNGAFAANANTEVTTDIIFLQKREQLAVTMPDWCYVGQNEDGLPLNQYFIDNPDMMLGKMQSFKNMYGNDTETACIAPDGQNLAAELDKAVAKLQKNLAAVRRAEKRDEEHGIIPAIMEVRNFTFADINGKIFFRENNIMKEHYDVVKGEKKPLKGKKLERMRGLIEIRDIFRKLIDAQTENCSDAELAKIQTELNTKYDAFVKRHGYISDSANAAVFRDDDDYNSIIALEERNPETKEVRKSDIFSKRTIKPVMEITHVDTPQEAMQVCMDVAGKVDIGFMAALCETDEEKIIADLTADNLIYKNPETNEYEEAADYLSGNVRIKLHEAEKAAELNPEFSRNVAALEKAIPPSLGAGDISVRIGVPWVSKRDYMSFLEEYAQARFREPLFKSITGEYTVPAKSWDKSVAATQTFGTSRMSSYAIFERLLNNRDIAVYDKIETPEGKEMRVINKKETQLAQEKARQMKEAFPKWLWKDQERRDKYVKIYNELFNSIVGREYDGSHQSFPGMSPFIVLNEHQKNAVMRAKLGGNTLLAHCVGAGKSFEMAAATMEKKRLGLINKACVVVPKHLVGQMAAEWKRLYPEAKLLTASEKDFDKDHRQRFIARCCTGDYDAVIMSYQQFEKIQMSVEYRKQFLFAQIEKLTASLNSFGEGRLNDEEKRSVKDIERVKKNLDAKIKKLLDAKVKDTSLNFEQLGFDCLVVDEAHNYKNGLVVSKMSNVSGVSTKAAQKSEDILMKTQYLNQTYGEKNIIFATGTPVSNSMTELYIMQQYLRPSLFTAAGLQNFDDWASTFGEVVTQLELKPAGDGFRMKKRFAKFMNLPELMQMYKEFADIRTADMLKLPVPEIEGGKPQVIAAKPDEFQVEYMKILAARSEKIHSGVVDPKEDNMLKITNEARLLGLDSRCLNINADNTPSSKVNLLINKVMEIYEDTADTKGVQAIFCDIAVHGETKEEAPAPEKEIETTGTVVDEENGELEAAAEDEIEENEEMDAEAQSAALYDVKFSVYKFIKEELIRRGVPENEICFAGDAKNQNARLEMYSQLRSGTKRIVLASTTKMGTGANVQTKLCALHNLDICWKPSDFEQRMGRIVRQGNENPSVKIFNYVTEGTFDAYMLNLIVTKQKFISQLMSGKTPARTCEDVDEAVLNYSEMQAIASGNPLIKEKIELDTEVARLRLLESEHLNQSYRLEDLLVSDRAQLSTAQKQLALGKEDKEYAEAHQLPEGEFLMKIGNKTYDERTKAGEALRKEIFSVMKSREHKTIGEFRGFNMILSINPLGNLPCIDMRKKGQGLTYDCDLELQNDLGNITRVENALKLGIDKRLALTEKTIDRLSNDIAELERTKDAPFELADELAKKVERLVEVDRLLDLDKKDEVIMGEDESETETRDNDKDIDPPENKKTPPKHSR